MKGRTTPTNQPTNRRHRIKTGSFFDRLSRTRSKFPHERSTPTPTKFCSGMAREEWSISVVHFAQRPTFATDPHFGRSGF